jgi:hypothetical protein
MNCMARALEMIMNDFGYLQHGKAGEPMRSEQVPIRYVSWPIAGEWQAFFEGNWRKVYIQVNRLYIIYQGNKITIQIEGV